MSHHCLPRSAARCPQDGGRVLRRFSSSRKFYKGLANHLAVTEEKRTRKIELKDSLIADIGELFTGVGSGENDGKPGVRATALACTCKSGLGLDGQMELDVAPYTIYRKMNFFR